MSVAKHEERLAFSSASYLSRLLDRPDLLTAVRGLSGERFRELVTGIGLEDAGELVALASAEQLATAFDDDLFLAGAPGEDEALDVDRFLLWLEVLREAGDAFAADRLASLSEDFLAVVVEASALVIDEDLLGGASVLHGPWAREAVAHLESLIESSPTEEIDRFCLVSRRPRGFDALVAVLAAMDQEHHDVVSRVLEAASRASFDTLEEGDDAHDYGDEPDDDASPRGFGARLGDDVAHEREDRRTARGFVPAASARAFLKAAREGIGAQDERDPTTRAVLRDMAALRPPAPKAAAPATPDAREPAPWLSEAAPAAPSDGLASSQHRERVLHRELRRLLTEKPALYTERVEEVAYLVNALVAGSSLAGRSIRPVEAFELALATVELGMALGHEEPRDAVAKTPADVLFRRGFTHVYREVVLPAAHAARALVARGAGRGRAPELLAMDEAISGGRPWLAREAFVGAMPSDEGAVAEALAGLFDASPHLGGPRAPSFMATLADVAVAREVLARHLSKSPSAAR